MKYTFKGLRVAFVVAVRAFIQALNQPHPRYWHRVYRLKGGTPVGTPVGVLGARHYINCDINSEGYHELGFLSDGALFGRQGACTYLIDYNGRKLSRGYHDIHPLGEGRYRVKLGAMKDVISPLALVS